MSGKSGEKRSRNKLVRFVRFFCDKIKMKNCIEYYPEQPDKIRLLLVCVYDSSPPARLPRRALLSENGERFLEDFL